jgi:Sulfotransferase domain
VSPRGHDARHAARSVVEHARQLSSRWRALPDFLIVGAQKAGTTTLQAMLMAHPQVLMLRGQSEVHYFDHEHARGAGWYRSHFPLELTRSIQAARRRRPVITGEKTPAYLFHPHAAAWARDLVPEARIIAILRDPVERARSHYDMTLHRGREPLSFSDAIAAEPERTDALYERVLADPTAPFRGPLTDYSYVRRGLYDTQLARWQHAYTPGRLLILNHADLHENPDKVFGSVCEFLGIEAQALPHLERKRVTSQRTDIADDLRNHLDLLFSESNKQIAEMSGITWSGVAEIAHSSGDHRGT